MRDNCNDDFYHAVHAREADSNDTTAGGERISLVLKRALDRGGGKRGHGLAGEGRRARRVNRHAVSSGRSLESATTTSASSSSSRAGGGGGGGDSREESQSSKSGNGSNTSKRSGKSKNNNPGRSSK